MSTSTLFRALRCFSFNISLLLAASSSSGAPHYLGSKTCQECHKSEFEVWEKTKHATSFATLHKSPKFKDIVTAVGGDSNPRRNAICTQCHYTLEQADTSATPVAKSSVSCESCHGAASDWKEIHNDYGGKDVKKEAESVVHKAQRIVNSVKNGMIRPENRYDVAANCLNCHNLARPSLDGATITKMLAAGHPINPEYELVRYSQGNVRHRFYPPDVTKNAEMPPPELARWFITGAAVKLVSSTANAKKSDNSTYQEVQQKHIKAATAALSSVKSVPEAAALLAAPTEENARKLVAAIADKDLSAEAKGLLPAPGDYKQ
jgi:hypothetical protein